MNTKMLFCTSFAALMVAVYFLVQGTPVVASTPSSRPALASAGNPPTDQIIIKYKATAGLDARADAARSTQLDRLSAAGGVSLRYFRAMSGDAHVLKLPGRMPDADVDAIARKLAALPEVEYAEADRIARPSLIPNDPQFTNQWGYSSTFGINAPAAWDITTGTNSLVVAVIDTGILFNHPDLVGRTVPGYDFISDVWEANDGDGWETDPSDPGDWVAAGDCGVGEPAQNSSWHGTHVAGTIGAASNNGIGVSGVNWNARILPVRVLGRCGGYTSDIADGIMWAAGGLPGLPPLINPNPARVLNLSLGAQGSCEAAYQSAIDFARSQNALVVVSAGNDNTDASKQEPANCNGVVVVAATDSNGQKASFSNYDSIVDLSAPGVNILSTGNLGITTPGTHGYTYKDGTSMAVPHVSGVASLALTMRPNLTPDQTEQLLRDSVTAFPAGSTCTTSLCGTGIISAELAVRDIYVDPIYAGVKLGTPHQPFNTVNEANTAAWNGAWLKLDPYSYNEAVTFSKRLTLVSTGGLVTIGR